MLHNNVLNEITTATDNGTTSTLEATEYFLNYTACNPNSEIKFTVSNMILKVHSVVASYLVTPDVQS